MSDLHPLAAPDERPNDERIRRANRIAEFLKDEAIQDAFARMERRYYEEFLAAESSEARVRAWAQAKMLRQFEIELKTILDAGEEVAIIEAAKAEAERRQASRNH